MFSFFQIFLSSFVFMPTNIFNNISLRKKQFVLYYKPAGLNFHFSIMCSSDLFVVCTHMLNCKYTHNAVNIVIDSKSILAIILGILSFLFLPLTNINFVWLVLHLHRKFYAPHIVLFHYLSLIPLFYLYYPLLKSHYFLLLLL